MRSEEELIHFVENQLFRTDNYVNTSEFCEFTYFRIGKCRLGRTASSADRNFLDGTLLQRGESVLGDVRSLQFVWRAGEHAGNIHGDIAVACVLRLLGEAHPGLADMRDYPALDRHCRQLEALPVFGEIAQSFIAPT